MALRHGIERLLGKMAAAIGTVRTKRQAAPPQEAGPPTSAAMLRLTRLSATFAPMMTSQLPSTLDTPAMMSIPERQFLFGLASRYYSGEGNIVDAGIFLGASTRCFGEGVRANPRFEEISRRRPQPVVSFEKAVVTPTMPDFFKSHGLAFSAKPGESFESELRRNVEPVKDLVDLRIGDIMDTVEVGGPVEILFLDILKALPVSVHAFRLFYPKLIPGRSIVVQQDYFYEGLPWIKTHQETLAEYFDFIGEIGASAIFLCTRQIPEAAIDRLGKIAPAEQLRLASIAMQRSADPSRRFLMALSKMRLVRQLQGSAAARAYLDFVKGEFPEQAAPAQHERLSKPLREAEEICAEEPGRSRPDGRHATDDGQSSPLFRM